MQDSWDLYNENMLQNLTRLALAFLPNFTTKNLLHFTTPSLDTQL